MSSNVVGGAMPHQAPNAAMLIDFDNVTMGIRSDLQEELKNLLSSDIIKGKVAVRRAYADWRRYPQYIVPLTEASIDLIFAPAYGSAKKNATDIRLAIDALELVFTRPEIGTFVLLSGDSDFSSMVIKLKEYGKYVIGVGIRESSSDLLVMNCDEYYSYNALAGLVRNSDEEAVRWDPWELVTEAVQRMKRNGDVMRSDRLKQVMQEIDAQFDEKNLGMPKFSRFVQEAQAKGLVTVTKLENGQLEIGVPVGATATTEAAPVAASAAAAPADGAEVETREAREEREERRGGRRGRRGRGRDREREPRGAEGSEDAAPAAAASTTAAAPVAPAVDANAPLGSVARVGAVRPPAAAPVAAPAADTTVVAPPRDMIRVSPENDTIGLSGEKLTRAEAFDLVQRAVASLVKGVQTTTAVKVRKKSFELLGRDSETLAARMFERILRDAHDADVIDLRRRGDDYEVGRVAEAATISDQLAKKEAEIVQEQKAAKIASGTAGPSGLGTRGRAPARGGSRGGPPPELLMVGVVSQSTSAAAAAAAKPAVPATPVVAAPVAAAPVVAAPVAEAKPEPKAEAKPARGGKAAAKAPAKTAARTEPRTSAATKPVKAAKSPAKKAAKPAAKTPAKTPAKAAKPAAKAPAKAAAKSAAKPAAKAPAKKAAKKAAK
jgi:uncharacterized protein (TIGR00288 family)